MASTTQTPVGVLLWDIDGTLISNARSGPNLYQLAAHAVLPNLLPVPNIASHGRTDTEMMRLMVRCADLPPRDEETACIRCLDILNTLTAEHVADLRSARIILPGIPKFLSQASRVGYCHGLLTGNSRERAKIKLSAFRLWDYFDESISAFGDESEVRAQVVKLAVARAKESPNHSNSPLIVSIGDTSKDVEAALAYPIPVIGVATGIYSIDTLRQSGASLAISSFEKEGVSVFNWLQRQLVPDNGEPPRPYGRGF